MRYSEKLIAFGLNVAYYRRYRQITQEELAKRANVSISTIRKIENSNMYAGISLEKICSIATALDIPESELLTFRQVGS